MLAVGVAAHLRRGRREPGELAGAAQALLHLLRLLLAQSTQAAAEVVGIKIMLVLLSVAEQAVQEL
jgi:hypothetical protein